MALTVPRGGEGGDKGGGGFGVTSAGVKVGAPLETEQSALLLACSNASNASATILAICDSVACSATMNTRYAISFFGSVPHSKVLQWSSQSCTVSESFRRRVTSVVA